MKLRLAIGRFVDRLGRRSVNDRSPLCRLNERRLAFDVDRLGRAADLDRQRADDDAVPALTDDAGALAAS